MILEKMVVSLELSKKLKELNVQQESVFVWEYFNDKCHAVRYCPHAVVPNEYNEFKLYSAFTASKLGEILPNCVVLPNSIPFENFKLKINKFFLVESDKSWTNNFIVNYECDSTELTGENSYFTRRLTNSIFDSNLANAMAKMLIFLIENNLIITIKKDN